MRVSEDSVGLWKGIEYHVYDIPDIYKILESRQELSSCYHIPLPLRYLYRFLFLILLFRMAILKTFASKFPSHIKLMENIRCNNIHHLQQWMREWMNTGENNDNRRKNGRTTILLRRGKSHYHPGKTNVALEVKVTSIYIYFFLYICTSIRIAF